MFSQFYLKYIFRCITEHHFLMALPRRKQTEMLPLLRVEAGQH